MNYTLPVFAPKLPRVDCKPGCGDCCGVVNCNRGEAEMIEAYAAEHGVTPVRQGARCPYWQVGNCAIYPVRPFMCRLYGAVAGLACPHGCSTMFVDERRQRKLLAQYVAMGEANYFLHSSVYSDGEILNLIKDAASIPEGTVQP